MIRLFPLLALALAASHSAAAETWTVDDDGGAGVDFTELSVAVGSPRVADGDVLLVQPGTYDSLGTSRSLTVIGQGAEPGEVLIQNPGLAGENALIGVNGPFTLANVDFFGTLLIQQCTGPVTIANAIFNRVTAIDSGNVRLQSVCLDGYSNGAALIVENACLEISSSEVGSTCSVLGSERGTTYARIAGSNVTGLDGTDGSPFFPNGGTGASAVSVNPGAEACLIGSGMALTGGDGGLGYVCQEDGQGGAALSVANGAFVRLSGYVLHGGFIPDLSCPSTSPQADPIQNAGTLVQPVTPDPSLELLGVPEPGGEVRLIARAPGASSLQIYAGFAPVSMELPNLVGRLAITPDFLLGTTPAGGDGAQLIALLPVPAGLALGSTLYAQALSLHPGKDPRRLSNPVALVVQ